MKLSVICFLALIGISCSNKSKENPYYGQIIGTWTCTDKETIDRFSCPYEMDTISEKIESEEKVEFKNNYKMCSISESGIKTKVQFEFDPQIHDGYTGFFFNVVDDQFYFEDGVIRLISDWQYLGYTYCSGTMYNPNYNSHHRKIQKLFTKVD